MSKILSIVETAYRGTLEEQDDTILWLSHAVKNAGADISVMLRGNAVNYAIKGQDASGLTFGDLKQAHGPRIDRDVEAMIAKGIQIYLVQEDARDRGLIDAEFVQGIERVSRRDLPRMLDRFDQIWHW
jgi:sulfur relay (sulfurtransferase) DsrF/TusC family protein